MLQLSGAKLNQFDHGLYGLLAMASMVEFRASSERMDISDQFLMSHFLHFRHVRCSFASSDIEYVPSNDEGLFFLSLLAL